MLPSPQVSESSLQCRNAKFRAMRHSGEAAAAPHRPPCECGKHCVRSASECPFQPKEMRFIEMTRLGIRELSPSRVARFRTKSAIRFRASFAELPPARQLFRPGRTRRSPTAGACAPAKKEPPTLDKAAPREDEKKRGRRKRSTHALPRQRLSASPGGSTSR
jgi:hypothetical protein